MNPEDIQKRSFLKTLKPGRNYAIASLILGLTVLDVAAVVPPIMHAGASSGAQAGKIQNSQTMALLQAPLAYAPTLPARGGGDIAIVDGTALMPDSGPVGTSASVSNYEVSTQISTYVVRAGDTLSTIADMFGVSVNTLIWANDLKSKTIVKDQVLVILPISGIRHTIAKGDTIETIAKKYKADINEILQYNDIGLHDALTVGEIVMVPDAELEAPAVPATPAKKKSRTIGSGSANPFRGGSGPRIDGYFGVPVAAAHRTQGLHGYNGVDLGATTGTAILAAAPGTVIIAKSGGYNGGYGSYVVVSHDNGTQTLYAHMSKVLTSVGASVSRGQQIGAVGSTGDSTGPHLHFEIRGAANFCADSDNPCSTF